MSNTNISKINLNLLVALDALLTFSSVSKAATHCHVTQSAMSQSLKQLRDIFSDQLLVRGQSGQLTLTYKAKTLKPSVKEIIQNTQELFVADVFDINKARGVINIAINDYSSHIILPKLLKTIQQKAKNILIKVHHALPQVASSQLINQEIDFFIGLLPQYFTTIHQKTLIQDDVSLVTRRNHPIWKNLSKRNLIIDFETQYPYVICASHRDTWLEANSIKLFRELNIHRNISLVVDDAYLGLKQVSQSNALFFMMTQFVEHYKKELNLSYAVVKKPKFDNYETNLYWHEAKHHDPINSWLRHEIYKL